MDVEVGVEEAVAPPLTVVYELIDVVVSVVEPSKPFGRTHCSFSRTHAEHGHVFVVAASHLILRLRQPSHALITSDSHISITTEERTT